MKHTVHTWSLQTVALPVRMEEHVEVLISPLSVCVPVVTREITASTEVPCMHVYVCVGTYIQHLSMESTCTVCFIFSFVSLE